MRIKKEKGISGKPIETYLPDNPEDVKKLRELESAGTASSKVGFGDWRNSKKPKKALRLSNFELE